jgi:hypothetical protein
VWLGRLGSGDKGRPGWCGAKLLGARDGREPVGGGKGLEGACKGSELDEVSIDGARCEDWAAGGAVLPVRRVITPQWGRPKMDWWTMWISVRG